MLGTPSLQLKCLLKIFSQLKLIELTGQMNNVFLNVAFQMWHPVLKWNMNR